MTTAGGSAVRRRMALAASALALATAVGRETDDAGGGEALSAAGRGGGSVTAGAAALGRGDAGEADPRERPLGGATCAPDSFPEELRKVASAAATSATATPPPANQGKDRLGATGA